MIMPLAYAYTEAYQATGKDIYKDIARKIFTYVLRDMTSTGEVFTGGGCGSGRGEASSTCGSRRR